MICMLCKGSGSVTCLDHDGRRMWWDCQCCGGSGVQVQHGPAFIGPKSRGRSLERQANEGRG